MDGVTFRLTWGSWESFSLAARQRLSVRPEDSHQREDSRNLKVNQSTPARPHRATHSLSWKSTNHFHEGNSSSMGTENEELPAEEDVDDRSFSLSLFCWWRWTTGPWTQGPVRRPPTKREKEKDNCHLRTIRLFLTGRSLPHLSHRQPHKKEIAGGGVTNRYDW